MSKDCICGKLLLMVGRVSRSVRTLNCEGGGVLGGLERHPNGRSQVMVFTEHLIGLSGWKWI